MTVIDKLNRAKGPLFTFELLPPLKGHSIERVYSTIETLLEFDPAYINFTSHRNEVQYKENTDGSVVRRVSRVRPGTIALAAAVKYKYNITVVPHLLCGGFTREETENALIEMNFLGIEDVFALRGDPPRGTRAFIPEKDGNTNASDLVNQIVAMGKGEYINGSAEQYTPASFCIGVAGYPEKHFEAPNMEIDMQNLKKKVDAGAQYIATQMFFNNEAFFRFRDNCHKAGINIPIIAGIKPIAALNDIKLLPQTFHIDIPGDLYKSIQKCKTDEAARQAGVEWTIMQSKELIKEGVPGIHYYTLGRADNIAKIVKGAF